MVVKYLTFILTRSPPLPLHVSRVLRTRFLVASVSEWHACGCTASVVLALAFASNGAPIWFGLVHQAWIVQRTKEVLDAMPSAEIPLPVPRRKRARRRGAEEDTAAGEGKGGEGKEGEEEGEEEGGEGEGEEEERFTAGTRKVLFVCSPWTV